GLKVDEETKRAATEFVEGFNAARADRISMQYLAQAQDTADRVKADTQFLIFAGLDSIVNWMRRFEPGLVDVHLNTTVHEIEWKSGYVRVDQFEADRAIITLPLGVLQSGSVRFIPELKEKDS